MAIIRGPLPQDRYFIIDRAWARDWRLSLKEKGALMYICSHHEAYDLTTEQMVAENDDGRDSVLSALRGLESKGYLHRVQRRLAEGAGTKRGAGTFDGYDYQITQPPACPARPKTRRLRKGQQPPAAGGEPVEPQVSTVNGLSGDGETGAGGTASGESAPKRDQGLGDQEKETPPTPRADVAATSVPGQRTGGGTDHERQPRPLGPADLADEVHRARGWSKVMTQRVLDEMQAEGRSWESVVTVMRRVVADEASQGPARLRVVPQSWWDDAAQVPARRRRPWCGQCVQTNRLTHGDRPRPCPTCSPQVAGMVEVVRTAVG